MNIAIGDYLPLGPEADPFIAARGTGADGVELRFGAQDGERHALLESGMPAVLRSRARGAGLELASVYLGYVVAHPLSEPQHAGVCARVLEGAAEAGARVAVVPLFGKAEPRDEDSMVPLLAAVRELAERAAAVRLRVGLETALPVSVVLALLQRLDHPALGIAYDVGTAARLGYDPVADLKLLGPAVCQLRVRDTTPDGRRVLLGQGVVGENWAAIRAQGVGNTERGEPWYVLEVPAGADGPAWARAETTWLREQEPT